MDLEEEQVTWWEQQPDIYDNNKPRWYGEAVGDQGGGFDEEIRIKPENYPAGTRVLVLVPMCPECCMTQDTCDCGFDWTDWIDDRYQ